MSCVAARGDLRKLDQTVVDLSEERAIFLAQQPELSGAGPVREGALGEVHRVRGGETDEGHRRQDCRGNLQLPHAGQGTE